MQKIALDSSHMTFKMILLTISLLVLVVQDVSRQSKCHTEEEDVIRVESIMNSVALTVLLFRSEIVLHVPQSLVSFEVEDVLMHIINKSPKEETRYRREIITLNRIQHQLLFLLKQS